MIEAVQYQSINNMTSSNFLLLLLPLVIRLAKCDHYAGFRVISSLDPPVLYNHSFDGYPSSWNYINFNDNPSFQFLVNTSDNGLWGNLQIEAWPVEVVQDYWVNDTIFKVSVANVSMENISGHLNEDIVYWNLNVTIPTNAVFALWALYKSSLVQWDRMMSDVYIKNTSVPLGNGSTSNLTSTPIHTSSSSTLGLSLLAIGLLTVLLTSNSLM